MASKHAIIIIKNEKDEYLQYYEESWHSYLFLNCKQEDSNDLNKIKDIVLEKLEINPRKIDYLFTKIHSKYSSFSFLIIIIACLLAIFLP